MSTLVIGICTGSRYAGVCLCIDDDVLEAVTVVGTKSIPDAVRDPETGKALAGNSVAQVATDPLLVLAGDTWQAAVGLIRAHADTIRARCTNARPLVVVEAIVPLNRSAVGKGRTLEKVIARVITQGALGMLLADQDVVYVPSDNYDERPATWYPAILSGPYPSTWSGRKGSERSVQRGAWAIAQAGLVARGLATPTEPNRPTQTAVGPAPTPTPAPAHLAQPTNAEEYVAALRGSVRTTKPETPAALLAAARYALSRVPKPAGVPDLTPQEIALDAVTRAGIAPHLNTPDGLSALTD